MRASSDLAPRWIYHEMLAQCRRNAGQASATLAKHWAGNGPTSRRDMTYGASSEMTL